MQHPYEARRPEYERLLAACQILSDQRMTLQVAARRILPLKPYYEPVAAQTRAPVLWLMAVNERESGSSLYRYFGNGQPLNRVTTLVPKGRGSFTGPRAFADGCIDALHLDHVDQVTDWCWTRMLYEDEAWNGFGPLAHGRHTGYLWAGTNNYDGGKYVSDGVWDPDAWG